MKSLELSVIRTEGVLEDSVDCSVFLGRDRYSTISFKSQFQQHQMHLPLTGELGLILHIQERSLGEICIDLAKLERNGLQWLPIMDIGHGPVQDLPEEVPLPRILVSLCDSRSRLPDTPIEKGKDLEEIESLGSESVDGTGREVFGEEENRGQRGMENRIGVERRVRGVGTREQEMCVQHGEGVEVRAREKEEKQTETVEDTEDCSAKLVVLDDLREQIKQITLRFDKECSENREKSLVIENIKKAIKDKDYTHEENMNIFGNIVNKLQKKIYQKRNLIRESDIEIKVLKEHIKTVEISKSCTSNGDKIVLLEKALKESEESRANLQKALEGLKISKKPKITLQDELNNNNSLVKEHRHQAETTNEKLITQEFYNQELLIQNQDLRMQLNVLKEQPKQSEDEGKHLKDSIIAEILSNNLAKDDLDDRIESVFPELTRKSTKIIRGIYVFNGKKMKIEEKGKFLSIILNGKELNYSDILEANVPKHEKNSFSLEDINCNIDALKPTNLIHNRSNFRENKLRILTKQW